MRSIHCQSSLRLFLFFSLAIIYDLSEGQSILSLEEALEIGLSRNYQIQILQANEEIARNNHTPANAGYLPTVSTTGTYSFSNTNTSQKFFNGDSRSASGAGSRNARAAVEANWTVFDGFRRQAIESQLDIDVRRSMQMTRNEMLELVRDIQLQYFELGQLQQEINLILRSIELNEAIHTLAVQKENIGVGSESEVLQAKSTLNADSISLIQQQGELTRKKVTFRHLINHLDMGGFTVYEEITLEPLPPLEEMLEAVQDRNPALLLNQLDQLNAQFQIKELKSVFFPKLDINASYNYNFSKAEVGFLLSNRTFGPSAQLSLTYDLFSGRNLKNELRNVELLQENIQKDQQWVLLQIRGQIAELYANYHNLQLIRAAIDNDIEIAERNTFLANELYRQGRNTSFEVREAVLREIQAKNQLITTNYQLKYISIQVHALAGTLVD